MASPTLKKKEKRRLMKQGAPVVTASSAGGLSLGLKRHIADKQTTQRFGNTQSLV